MFNKNLAIFLLVLTIPAWIYFETGVFKTPVERCVSRMMKASLEYTEADTIKACQCIEDAKKSATTNEELLTASKPCTEALMKPVILRQCEAAKAAEDEDYKGVDCECYYEKLTAKNYETLKAHNFRPLSEDDQQDAKYDALAECAKK
jgi:hypothetical protein